MRLRPDVPRLLELLGIKVRRSGQEWRGFCPEPEHSGRSRRRDSGSWQIDAEGRHYCHSCGFGGGPIVLVMAARGATAGEASRWLIGHFGDALDPDAKVEIADVERKIPTTPRLKIPPAEWLSGGGRLTYDSRKAIEYLHDRGVTDSEIARYDFYATPDVRFAPYRGRIIVPIVVRNQLVDFVARLYVDAGPRAPKALSGKRDEGALKELALWNYDRLDPEASTVYVAEGVWGAMAIIRAGFPNTVATCGSAWSPERTELLAGWDRIVLIPDGDEAGSAMVERCSELRFRHRLEVVELPTRKQPDDFSPAELGELIGRSKTPSFGARLYDSPEIARSWRKVDLE